MIELPPARRTFSETQFAELVEELARDPARRHLLTGLLKEGNPAYEQRGSAAAVRMRGWVLLAFARFELPEDALVYVLEELDNGRDAYLVAAAARVLRSSGIKDPAMAGYLVRAITNIREHDDTVCLEQYGAYAVGRPGTTAIREILASLRWLGAAARGVLPELESLRRYRVAELETTIDAIRDAEPAEDDCCAVLRELTGFHRWTGRSFLGIHSVEFEDQSGERIAFREFFRGQPAVVVFFYSRCENPRKCSLTVAKLARVQRMLAERGLDGRIRTAAITYDPQFDLPSRLFDYGKSRGVRMDGDHKMLRSADGMSALRAHFCLGVNFVESLVNRHKIEAFVLDGRGEVVGSFERIQWDEREVVQRAEMVLHDAPRPAARDALGVALPLIAAILPKCPMCWAAYLSVFGIAGLGWAPYFRWLVPAMVVLMSINLGSLWLRGFRRGRLLGFYLAAAGTLSTVVLGLWQGIAAASVVGALLTLAGALAGATNYGVSWLRRLPGVRYLRGRARGFPARA